MAKMAELDAALTELPDEAKDYMQGFYRGRDEGVALERERIIKLLESMQETALATQTDEGFKTAWIIENAKVLIKGENK